MSMVRSEPDSQMTYPVEQRSAERRARHPEGSDRRLLRRRQGRVLLGLCAGIADYVGANVRTIRWLFVLTGVFTLGTMAFGYLLLALMTGREPALTAP